MTYPQLVSYFEKIYRNGVELKDDKVFLMNINLSNRAAPLTLSNKYLDSILGYLYGHKAKDKLIVINFRESEDKTVTYEAIAVGRHTNSVL